MGLGGLWCVGEIHGEPSAPASTSDSALLAFGSLLRIRESSELLPGKTGKSQTSLHAGVRG